MQSLPHKHYQHYIFFVGVSFHLPVLTEIFCAIILPPITAKPVHRQCPTVPPTATP